MNSVSKVACIRAARVYDGRAPKAASRDEDTWARRKVRIVVINGDGAPGVERFEVDRELEGIVVEISVWTSTMVSIVLYT